MHRVELRPGSDPLEPQTLTGGDDLAPQPAGDGLFASTERVRERGAGGPPSGGVRVKTAEAPRETALVARPSPTAPGLFPALERRLVRAVLKALGSPPMVVRLWTGEAIVPDGLSARPATEITIRDRRTLWRLVWNPLVEFGDAYSDGRLEIEGDAIAMLREFDHTLHRRGGDRSLPWWMRWRPRLRRPNSLDRSRENIHHHYDIGNDFYRLWLDAQLVYTCAYYPEADLPLEQAQIAKLDHVCRKLQLRPGQAVIEAGCGWGALALHMARHYGVSGRAFNISREQVRYARERARAEGLADRIEFVEDDWRNIRGTCDAFVSVGMLEHVGRENFCELGRVIDRCLAPEGRGLIHTIGRNYPHPYDEWMRRRIFPGAYPPALSEMTAIFEPHDFSILDVENLRLHYARTCRDWLERFERSAGDVRAMFDERFVRMWRLYLSIAVAAFESGVMQLFQVVFARGGCNAVPLTRAHLYE